MIKKIITTAVLTTALLMGASKMANANGFAIDGWSQETSRHWKAHISLEKGHSAWWIQCRAFTDGTFYGISGKAYVRDVHGWKDVVLQAPKNHNLPKPTDIKCQFEG